MLANAFKRAQQGSKCRKCGAIVNLAYKKRHDQECTPVVKREAVNTDTDGIEIISENIIAASVVKPSTSKSTTPSPAALKRSISILDDEIVTLDSDSESELPKKRSSPESEPERKRSNRTPEGEPERKRSSQTPTILKPAVDIKPSTSKTARSQVYIQDPSRGMSLTEVYEKLMEQLEKLCNAGRDAGHLIATETNQRLSQSPKKQRLSATSDSLLQTIASDSNLGMDEDDIQDVVQVKTDMSFDPDDAQVLQADSRYGSSYIVRFFWVMLKRVLSRQAGIPGEEAERFWGEDLRKIYWLVTMSDSEQYLFVRLCLRQRKWLTVEELQKYATNATSIIDIASGLVAANLFEESDSPTSSITLEEVLTKLTRIELSRLAKVYKVEHRVKAKEIYDNIQNIANGKSVFGDSMYSRVLANAKKHLCKCYRIKQYALDLFTSILTLYCPISMNSAILFDPGSSSGLASNLMFQLLQVDTKKLEFCGPKEIVRCINIYATLEELLDYVEAKKLEILMAWDKRGGNYHSIVRHGREAVRRIKDMEINGKEKLKRMAALPHYLRRFCGVWVLARCCIHCIEAIERLRNYEDAVEMLEWFLKNEVLIPFCPDRRGFLYDRLALDLHSHLKHKEKALDACIRGIMDSVVRNKDRLLLQDRATRISPEFELILKIDEPKWIHISGKVIDKNLGDTRVNHFYIENINGEKEIVSVEEVALRHFRQEHNFWSGLHSEGGIWHTIFGVICYDIVFDHNVDGVWFSPLQDAPADMNTLDFFENRKSKFEERLSLLLEDSRTDELEEIMRSNYIINRGRANAQIDWNVFSEFEELQDFMSCIRREQLAMIIRRIIEDHRHHRSGFPDLTLWDRATKRLAVIEVKGPGDKLSTKQRLWLDFFSKHGVEAFVCSVSAIKNRRIQNLTASTNKKKSKKQSATVMEEEEVEEILVNDVYNDEEFVSSSEPVSSTRTSRITRSFKKKAESTSDIHYID